MKEKSITMLRELIFKGHLTQKELDELKNDPRKGVQKLLLSYEKRQIYQKKQEKKYMEMQYFEQKLQQSGFHYIAGIDEAGRGPLAGPVVAAAVILPKNIKLIGLNDSKLLSEEKRNMFFDKIKAEAISYGISVVSNEVIDDINIYEATKMAMRHAVDKLSVRPEYVLIDAMELGDLSCPEKAIIKGDQRSISIAAASVLAKVTRDQI
ncbi:MAG TPA: ribonuclease HII, partial [Bacillota bacterium]|nr:ribonuclease HII [Bacillota bacterium]